MANMPLVAHWDNPMKWENTHFSFLVQQVSDVTGEKLLNDI